MSPRLDLPIACAIWVIGFVLVGLTGSWLPLAVMALLGAGRLVAGDASTRAMLKPRVLPIVLGLSGAVVMFAATRLIYGWLAHAFPALPVETARLYGLLRGEGLRGLSLALVIGTVAASEEIVWRGRVLSSPADATPPRWPDGHQLLAVLGKTAIYAAAHAPSTSPLLIGVAFACGAAWGVLRVATRSLWTPLLTHVLWDMCVMVLWPLAG